APSGGAGDEGGEQFLGGGEEFFAGAGAVGGQGGVAAGDQPLAGELRAGDLGQVLLIEQGHVQRAVLGHQLADGGGAQRGDPPVGVLALQLAAVFGGVEGLDPGAGNHPPVAHHDHLGQAELVPDDLDDLGEGGRVAGV